MKNPRKGGGPLPKTIDGKIPSWLRRAMNPKTPTTKDNETMRTASRQIGNNEILFPTVRMIDGQLKKLTVEEAYQMSLRKKDFVVTKGPKNATLLSKRLSKIVSRERSD